MALELQGAAVLCDSQHDVRLREYALKIGERINLSKDRRERLIFAALYHDLGKISVPAEILNKPDRLSREEFENIRRHPTDGRVLLEKTYLRNVGAVVEQHHERLDGSDYPRGLRSEDTAVADAFDAMTSDRACRLAR